MSERIDPITLEIIQNGLVSLTEEMTLTILRTSYSLTLREAQDFSMGVCDHLGQFAAQTGAPIHLGSFPRAMRVLVDRHGETTRPGDVFIFNDPYGSEGMHLPDVFVVKPVFMEERVVGYAVAMGHQCDMGGLTPGSMAVYATEIYQEGLRIPMLKFYEAGEPNQTLIQLIEKNVRVPVLVMGDLNAQVAACRLCERGLIKLIQRYGGVDVFATYVKALQDYAERMMREEIISFPDGVYEFEDYIDGMGDSQEPIRFKVAVIVDGDEVTIDWTGTSKQVKAAINGPIASTYSMAYAAIRCLVRTPIPNCQGFTRPIKVVAPLGTIVNPTEPAACASRGINSYRLQDTMFGALAQFAPDRVPAACEGGPTALSFGGRDKGEPWVALDPVIGNWGGRHDRDGALAIAHWHSQNMSIEFTESRVPVEIVCYSFAQNSGGPGRYRGGHSCMKAYRMLTDGVNLNIRSDRRAHLPYGLNGGLPGTPSWNIVNPGPKQRLLPTCPMGSTVLNKGDVFLHVQPGGGGYGNPLERDPEKVLDEVLNEFITLEYAFDVYGVVINDGVVDNEATVRRRVELVALKSDEPAYLRHFHQSIGIDPKEHKTVSEC